MRFGTLIMMYDIYIYILYFSLLNLPLQVSYISRTLFFILGLFCSTNKYTPLKWLSDSDTIIA